MFGMRQFVPTDEGMKITMRPTLSLIPMVFILSGAFAVQSAHAQECRRGSKASNCVQKTEADIVDVAIASGKFKTLVAAVKAAGLVDVLKAKGPLTVFAPSDEAFDKLPKGTVESLLKPENKHKLISILTYHVVPARLPAAEVVKSTGVLTAQGQRLKFKCSGDAAMVDNATIVTTDIEAKNGVVHVIDAVLLPSESNAVEVTSSAGKFKTLLAAAKAAGLAETLSSGGPFTIFAPTDEACSRLPEGTVENLLKPENIEQLAAILKLHVVAGRLDSTAVVNARKAKSLGGEKLKFRSTDNGVTVNDAKVLATDINASNAIIHVIDSVILPKSEK